MDHSSYTHPIQSASQSVITTLLPMEHMVHYTLDLLECRGFSGLITQNPGNLSSLAGTTVGPRDPVVVVEKHTVHL